MWSDHKVLTKVQETSLKMVTSEISLVLGCFFCILKDQRWQWYVCQHISVIRIQCLGHAMSGGHYHGTDLYLWGVPLLCTRRNFVVNVYHGTAGLSSPSIFCYV